MFRLSGILVFFFFFINTAAAEVNDRPAIVKLTQERIKYLMEHFCMDSSSRNYGGFVWGEVKPYAGTRKSIYAGQYLFAAYLYPDFKEYYNNPETLKKVYIHLDFMLRRQRPNGSINLWTKSTGGSNEVGFTLPGLIEVYKRVDASNVAGRDSILAGLEKYIKKGAACIRNNFPYSSNHRWAANCGPLAMSDSIFPDTANTAYIQSYLRDGIDIDDKGMYFEERSPNYNGVANWGLIELADYWGKTDYLDLVALNLDYNLAMRQPNGEVETLFSHRQDRGDENQGWGEYYHYKRLAIEQNNGIFASAADQLLAQAIESNNIPGGAIPLIFLFDNEKLVNDNVKREPIPDNYIIKFTYNPIWRYRTKDIGVTLAADKGDHWWDITQGSWMGYARSDVFMSYHYMDAIIDAIRIRWADGNQSFHPESIEYLENGAMKMVYDDPGWDHVAHFRPKEEWGPRKVQGHNKGEVLITPMEAGKFKMEIEITGWDEVHTNIQLLLRQNCTLRTPSGDEITMQKNGENFSMDNGTYYLQGPSGAKLKISGIPESEHILKLTDDHYIETGADSRCHKLVVGLYTPVKAEIIFEPVK